MPKNEQHLTCTKQYHLLTFGHLNKRLDTVASTDCKYYSCSFEEVGLVYLGCNYCNCSVEEVGLVYFGCSYEIFLESAENYSYFVGY